MLFEARNRVMTIIDDIDSNTSKSNASNTEAEDAEETQPTVKTYDEAIQDYKHHVRLAKDFFKI